MDIVAYLLAWKKSKKYTEDSLVGVGALKGAPCKIQSITDGDDDHTVVFAWKDDLDVTHTSTMVVLDGEDGTNGTSIEDVDINATTGHLIITLDTGTTLDAGAIPPEIYIGSTEPESDVVKVWYDTSDDDEDDLLAVINDNETSENKTWSSEKIDDAKQDKLVSGTNIKTINGESILGSGNIVIQGGGGGGATIDDTTTASDKVWSSQKVSNELLGLTNNVFSYIDNNILGGNA